MWGGQKDDGGRKGLRDRGWEGSGDEGGWDLATKDVPENKWVVFKCHSPGFPFLYNVCGLFSFFFFQNIFFETCQVG